MKNIIFDCDGTIVDSIGDIRASINRTMDHFGYPQKSEKEVVAAICRGPVYLVRTLLPEEAKEGEIFEKCLAFYRSTYGEHECELTDAYEGIRELVRKLRKNGCKVAVNTNKNQDHCEKILRKIFGDDAFDAIVGFDNVHPGKPDPYGALKAAKLIGADPKETVYVGDSDVDILTGKNAGMKTIGVLWGYRSKDVLLSAGADLLAQTPLELEALLLDKTQKE